MSFTSFAAVVKRNRLHTKFCRLLINFAKNLCFLFEIDRTLNSSRHSQTTFKSTTDRSKWSLGLWSVADRQCLSVCLRRYVNDANKPDCRREPEPTNDASVSQCSLSLSRSLSLIGAPSVCPSRSTPQRSDQSKTAFYQPRTKEIYSMTKHKAQMRFRWIKAGGQNRN